MFHVSKNTVIGFVIIATIVNGCALTKDVFADDKKVLQCEPTNKILKREKTTVGLKCQKPKVDVTIPMILSVECVQHTLYEGDVTQQTIVPPHMKIIEDSTHCRFDFPLKSYLASS